MQKPKSPVKVASILARRISTGRRIEKYGKSAVSALHGASLGLIGVSILKRTNGITLPIIGMVGITAVSPLRHLARTLPKKLKTNTLEKLIGKPRLATLTAKSVSDISSKSMLYLIANARTNK